MAANPDPHFPGPAALGRGVVVTPASGVPDGFPADAVRIRIDDDVVAHPSPAVARLHLAWVRREPVVIELAADNATLRARETTSVHPWLLPHGFTFERERLHWLTWANTYDARTGSPIWWHGELARRRGGDPSEVADVRIDGVDAWADGGPRGPVPASAEAPPSHLLDGIGLVHR
ncbi:MAG TPA: hypothetical protein VJ978_10650, partial [Nitriliruptoraceae bacterium]|nr:hypothetical protein [Nitriliruptoraceae bacterium]